MSGELDMQNFFISAEKPNRATPAQLSGRTIAAQFRVRHKGESVQVLKVTAESYPNSNDTVGVVHIVVKSPEGEVLFDHHIYPER